MNALNKTYAWRRCYAPDCQHPVDPNDPEGAMTAMPLCFPHELSDNAWRVLNYLEGAVALYAYKGQLVVTDESCSLSEFNDEHNCLGPRHTFNAFVEMEAWLERIYWRWVEDGCTEFEKPFIDCAVVRWAYDIPWEIDY